jgi:hypothetical protein
VLGAALKRLSKRDKALKLAMIECLYLFGALKSGRSNWPHIICFLAILVVLSDFPNRDMLQYESQFYPASSAFL